MSDFDPTRFNPKEHQGEGGKRGDNGPVPPGSWVCYVKSFSRNERKGKAQIDLSIAALLGPKGNRVPDDHYDLIFETVTLTKEAVWKFSLLCQAIGQNDPFNVMSDKELSAAIKFKPFKAKVKHQSWNGENRAKLDSFTIMGDAERVAATEILDTIATQDAMGSEDDYDRQDDEGYQSSFTDDDIPF